MLDSTRIFIWSVLCIGLAFSEKETGCLESSWTCTTKTTCPNPQKEVRDGKQILRTCVTGEGISGVCCITGAKAGEKSDKKCREYAKYVYIPVFSGMTNTSKNKNTCVDSEKLIFNGQEAAPREFPHMALVGSLWGNLVDWHCGGSLVSNLYVLSAAHCKAGTYGKARRVRLGEHNHKSRDDDDVGDAEAKDYDIVEWLDHPGYGGTGINDITLYKLNQTVEFTEFVRPICLNSNPQFTHTRAIATGWGLTENNTFSDTLRKVGLNITDCVFKDEYKRQSLICAADLPNKKDTCTADSGGPLQVSLDDPYCMFLELAVTAFGPEPCGTDFAGGYTRVSLYLPWIESIVWP